MFLFVRFPGIDPAAHPPKCLPDETALDVGPRVQLQVLLDHPWCALEGNVRSLPVGRRFHIFTAAFHAAGVHRGDGHKAAGQALRTTIGA